METSTVQKRTRPNSALHNSGDRRAGCVSVLESIRDTLQLFEEGIRSRCSDEPRRKKKEEVKRPEEKMTGAWGPSHTLSFDDEYESNSDPQHVPKPQPATPKKTQEKGDDSDGTPATMDSTPERGGRKFRKHMARAISCSGEPLINESDSGSTSNQNLDNKDSITNSSCTNSDVENLGRMMGNISATVSSGMHAIKESRTNPSVPLHLLQFTSYHGGSCARCVMSDTNEPDPDLHLDVVSTFDSDMDQHNDITAFGCGNACIFPVNDLFGKDVNKKSPLERRKDRHVKQIVQMQTRGQQHGKAFKKNSTSNGYNNRNHVDPNFWQEPDADNQNMSSLNYFPPLEEIIIKDSEYRTFSESVSELTMASHSGNYGPVVENRRMAYYAVGNRDDSMRRNRGGGNRKCYFTGKLIVTGSPFYAGSVQQGMRTLIVFCLPSAIGLPKNVTPSKASSTSGKSSSLTRTSPDSVTAYSKEIMKQNMENSILRRTHFSSSSMGSEKSLIDHDLILENDSSVSSDSCASQIDNDGFVHIASGSHSSLDISIPNDAIDSDDDINDEDDYDNSRRLISSKTPLERESYLRSLPEPNQDLLDLMKTRYPEQFATLPIQVRGPNCWRLYVRFCFFSGLPIAEGELHYKVKDEVVKAVGYVEEIGLSHEVLEVVNGVESADIVRLPNKKTFEYLKKHYVVQCGKLTKQVFDRKSWEKVLAEI